MKLFRQLFRGRPDLYPTRFVSKKTGKPGYAPAWSNKFVPGVYELPKVKCRDCTRQAFKPVDDAAVIAHLKGRHVMGVYPMQDDETCWFLAVDFDKSTWMDDVRAFVQTSRRLWLPVAKFCEAHRSMYGSGQCARHHYRHDGCEPWPRTQEEMTEPRNSGYGTAIQQKACALEVSAGLHIRKSSGATIALIRVQDPRIGRSFPLLRSTSTTRRRHVVPRIAEANSNLSRMYYGLLARLGFVALLLVSGSVLAAAVAPPLNTAASYTVLGTNSVPTVGTVTCTNSGSGSTIDGDVGSTFNSITNSGCTITGAINAPVPSTVVTDFESAYGTLDSLNPICDGVVPTTSTTLAPGVYCSVAGTTIGAGIVFTLNGSATDIWVFKIGTGGTGALTGNGFKVLMAGTALACNVYWRTAGAATLTASNFQGTILSGAAITMTGGSYVGRAFATTDVTVTDAAPMTFAGCTAPASITVNKNFIPNSAATVPVALSCTSGTVTSTPLNAAVGTPAVFQVTGASAGATCTATETVPAGYTANQANCVAVALNGNCTITNTLIPLPVVNIPTMSRWMYVLLGMMLVATGWMRFASRARSAPLRLR